MTQPEREPRRRYEDEKEEEKQHEKEDEKRDEKNWDEKWRRDPINAGCWAAIFIWAGLVLLGETTNWGPDTFWWWTTWALIMAGAGVILLLCALIRLLTPAYRRPLIGNVILGAVFLGVGLNELSDWNWATTGAIILIGIGLTIVLGGIFRKRK